MGGSRAAPTLALRGRFAGRPYAWWWLTRAAARTVTRVAAQTATRAAAQTATRAAAGATTRVARYWGMGRALALISM